MSGKMISDRSVNTKGDRTPLNPKFHNCVAVRLVVRHRTLKVTNL
ncbi:hypothetical protein [Nostoc sp. LPT]|nr:hypothetical protein [Nostoc sp. LPT]